MLFLGASGIDKQRADSLRIAIDQGHEIRDKIGLYFELSMEYKDENVDSARIYAQQAFTLAQRIEDEEHLGRLYMLLGDLALMQDSIDRSEACYQKAIPYLLDAEADTDLIVAYHKMGNRYLEKANLPGAMDVYLKASKLAEENGDLKRLARLNNNIGVIYIKLNQPDKALELYSDALKLFESINDSINVAGTTTNIGSIYLQLGDYDIARKYYLKGYEIFKQIQLKAGEAHALFKLGALDEIQKEHQQALDNFFKSLEIQQGLFISPGVSRNMFLAETYSNIGIVYFNMNDFDQAFEYLTLGYDLAIQTRQSDFIASTSEYLSKIYKSKGEYKDALAYYEIYKQYSDSTFNERNIRELAQLEMQHHFESALKENEMTRKVEEQNQKRRNLYYLLLTIGMSFILIIVALLLKLEKNKKKEVEIERAGLLEKLEHANKELTTYVMYLLKKNEFILTIIEKLKKTRLDAKPENKKALAELISELQSNLNSVSWEDFELRFQEVHTEFYTRLSQRFPDLSNNEIRLCAFFKLNMTTKEIAAITYQSLNSIKVARYRLRKKLNLKSGENLHTFLAQF